MWCVEFIEIKKAVICLVLFAILFSPQKAQKSPCSLFAQEAASLSERVKGLWCRTSNEQGESGARYIYFDKKAKEVVFYYDDVEELYVWQESRFYPSSATIRTTNAAIRTLKRTIFITEKGDDFVIAVKNEALIVDESNLWNGVYRKK